MTSLLNCDFPFLFMEGSADFPPDPNLIIATTRGRQRPLLDILIQTLREKAAQGHDDKLKSAASMHSDSVRRSCPSANPDL